MKRLIDNPYNLPTNLSEAFELVLSATALKRGVDNDTLDLLAGDVANALMYVLGKQEFTVLESVMLGFLKREFETSGSFTWSGMRKVRFLGDIEFSRSVLGPMDDDEVSKLFGVPPETLRAWLSEGLPESIQIRARRIAEIAGAFHKIFRENRIHAIIRTSLPALGGASVLEA